MAEENLVTMVKYEDKDSINPAEQMILCIKHYNKIKGTQENYQIIKLNSSMPHAWCESCNPMN